MNISRYKARPISYVELAGNSVGYIAAKAALLFVSYQYHGHVSEFSDQRVVLAFLFNKVVQTYQICLFACCFTTYQIYQLKVRLHRVKKLFAESVFPSRFKLGQITPILKKQGLAVDDPSSYRPISNLNTFGKIIERLAQSSHKVAICANPQTTVHYSLHTEHFTLQKQL